MPPTPPAFPSCPCPARRRLRRRLPSPACRRAPSPTSASCRASRRSVGASCSRWREREETLVAFEAPHRLRQTLADIEQALGDRDVAVCRELTKLYEEVFRGRVSEALRHFAEPRGEFTLVIAGAPAPSADEAIPPEVIAEMRRLREEGVGAQAATAQLSRRYGLPRRRLYRIWLSLD